MLDDAIGFYRDLLTDDLAISSQEFLDAQQRRRGLAFGDKPLCSVLRPRFLTPDQDRLLRRVVRVLSGAFAIAHRQAIAGNPTVAGPLGLTGEEWELARLDPGFDCPYPTSRLDAFFVSERELFFTEYNSETPAAAAYVDALSEVFLGLPAMRAFGRRYGVRPIPARFGVSNALLDAYRQWSGRSEAPRIAIVDWREVPTYSEFVLFADHFRSLGLECVIADARELEYRGGRLMAGDFPIDLVYKRILIGELIERGGLDHPLVRAVRDRAVCMVNPFAAKVLFKKSSLAVLADERNAGLFDDEQRRVIADHIPWTRVVEERTTRHEGQEVDLIPHILRHREQFVLKPNDAYGGAGIVLGWTVDEAEWTRAVEAALASPYVVQQRVGIPSESYPSLIDGRVAWIDRQLDTNPYVCDGAYMEGCLTRISTAPLINVTAGGGSTVPTFLVEPR